MNKINFSLIGKPGAGKGTYGKLLSEALGCPLVVMGDVLRMNVLKGTEIGKEVDKFQREGRLVNDSLVSQALLSYLQDLRCKQGDDSPNLGKFGFILDGFPRTLTQAKMLTIMDKGVFKSDGITLSEATEWPDELKISFAVNIEVPDIICVDKMKGRRKCSKCDKSFNMTHVETPDGFFMPPQLPDPYPCDKCDMDRDWIIRSDDTEEIFQKRISEFHEQSSVVTQFFAEDGKLLEFVPYKGVKDMPILQDLVKNEANALTS